MLQDVLLISTAMVYAVISVLLFVFGANLIALSVRVWRRGVAVPQPTSGVLVTNVLPRVTVQLPIYNELYVSRRVIDAVANFDYPLDRLQIQVLDDSTDETSLIVADAVERLAAAGVDIVHLQRRSRNGYKAGALAEGMKTATGEFVAIFDADFIPSADFLRRTLSRFDAENVAFVQARWGHANRDYSWLTRLQALAIDGHFSVEQAGRGQAGYWFNFNGTAGVWRVAAIHDAGGWKADTLTEDLDLSYRAHLRGWRARFAEDLVVPGEIPAQLTGFRRQQHRWARGSLECAYRLLPDVWRSGERFMTRMQASLHLCSYFIQLLLLMLLLIYPLVVVSVVEHPRMGPFFGIGYLLALTSFAPTVFFVTGSRQGGRRWWRDLPNILLITAFGAGLMVNTARAALQIFTRPNPAFERTAKFGLDRQRSTDQTWTLKRYQLAPDPIVFFEFALGLYAMFSAGLAWRHGNYGVFVYATILGLGLLGVAGSTFAHTLALFNTRQERKVAVQAEVELLAAAGPAIGR